MGIWGSVHFFIGYWLLITIIRHFGSCSDFHLVRCSCVCPINRYLNSIRYPAFFNGTYIGQNFHRTDRDEDLSCHISIEGEELSPTKLPTKII